MSYRVKYTTPTGQTGHWSLPFSTRGQADAEVEARSLVTGYTYTVEEVPEPGSTAAHHVEILQARVKEMEAVQKAMSQDLAFALQLGDALRQAMRTGEWRAGHDRNVANSARTGWDRFKPSLAKAPSVPVGASDALREGGDSDPRRLEALRAFLEGNEDASLSWWEGEFNAVAEDVAITAPTLLALADKLAEKEDKP